VAETVRLFNYCGFFPFTADKSNMWLVLNKHAAL